MINARIERHRPFEVADPNLDGAGIEIESAFFVDLSWGVGRGKNLHADFWCASEKNGFLFDLRALLAEPRYIGCLDSIGGRNGAFGEGRAAGEQALKESGNPSLTTRVTSSRRWTHDDMSVPVGLNPIGELGELLVSHELAPAREVEACLGLEIGQLNGDRHELIKSMQVLRKQPVKSSRALAPIAHKP
jgi:hypothetical protein